MDTAANTLPAPPLSPGMEEKQHHCALGTHCHQPIVPCKERMR